MAPECILPAWFHLVPGKQVQSLGLACVGPGAGGSEAGPECGGWEQDRQEVGGMRGQKLYGGCCLGLADVGPGLAPAPGSVGLAPPCILHWPELSRH